MEVRNRVGIGMSYRPARLHRLAELVTLESILGLLKSLKFGLCTTTYIVHMQSDTLYVIHFHVNYLELMCFVSQSLVQYYNLLALLRNKQLNCIYKTDLIQQARGEKNGSPLILKSSPLLSPS
jgi:hypothetical protein